MPAPPQDLISRLLGLLTHLGSSQPVARPSQSHGSSPQTAPGQRAAAPMVVADGPIVCRGVATYTAVGPHQATGGGALSPHGVRPVDGTVAIGDPEKIFGLDKPELAKIAPQIQSQPTGLDQQLLRKTGPLPPYSVGDVGDENIRGARNTSFDIYRFRSQPLAWTFKYPAPTAITIPNVPGVHCPPDFVSVQ